MKTMSTLTFALIFSGDARVSIRATRFFGSQPEIWAKITKQLEEITIIIELWGLQLKVLGPVSHLNTYLWKGVIDFSDIPKMS